MEEKILEEKKTQEKVLEEKTIECDKDKKDLELYKNDPDLIQCDRIRIWKHNKNNLKSIIIFFL